MYEKYKTNGDDDVAPIWPIPFIQSFYVFLQLCISDDQYHQYIMASNESILCVIESGYEDALSMLAQSRIRLSTLSTFIHITFYL